MKTSKKVIDKDAIVYEYFSSGTTLRRLSQKYGIDHRKIHRWVMAYKAEQQERKPEVKSKKSMDTDLPADVKKLQEELRKAQLHNKVLEAMIDIGKEQYGIDLRKKPGAKQS